MNTNTITFVDAIQQLKKLENITVGEYNKLNSLLTEAREPITGEVLTTLIQTFSVEDSLLVSSLVNKHLSPKTREPDYDFTEFRNGFRQ